MQKERERERGKEREKEREKLTLSPVRAEIFDSVASRGWWRYLAPFQQCVHTFYLAINSRAASDASIVLDNFLDRSFRSHAKLVDHFIFFFFEMDQDFITGLNLAIERNKFQFCVIFLS